MMSVHRGKINEDKQKFIDTVINRFGLLNKSQELIIFASDKHKANTSSVPTMPGIKRDESMNILVVIIHDLSLQSRIKYCPVSSTVSLCSEIFKNPDNDSSLPQICIPIYYTFAFNICLPSLV